MRHAAASSARLRVRLRGAVMLPACPSAKAEPVADFYRGKTISLYVGFPPGGGYDLYARVFAPHFTRHIPGNPQIVIKTMLGGSRHPGRRLHDHITPQDGTSLGLFLDALTLGKVLGGPGDFDPVKLTWIGRIVSTATVSVVWHTSPVQTIEEAKKREILMAGTVPSNTSNFIPAALNDLIGTKIKVIMGFRGSPDQALAMLRGEVNSIGGMSWEAIQTNHQEWITEKKIRDPLCAGRATHQGAAERARPARLRHRRALAQHPGPARQRPRHRALARGRARHSARARGGAAQGLHGDDAGPGIHRRDQEAQSRPRAAERRGGAEDRRSLGRHAEGADRPGQALYRRNNLANARMRKSMRRCND